MKKNSTSKIVVRSLLVVAVLVLANVLARFIWQTQMLGPNTDTFWGYTSDLGAILMTHVIAIAAIIVATMIIVAFAKWVIADFKKAQPTTEISSVQ